MNWTDDGWNAFAAENDQIASFSPQAVHLLKEAWLHGARAALAEATKVLDTTLPEKPQ